MAAHDNDARSGARGRRRRVGASVLGAVVAGSLAPAAEAQAPPTPEEQQALQEVEQLANQLPDDNSGAPVSEAPTPEEQKDIDATGDDEQTPATPEQLTPEEPKVEEEAQPPAAPAPTSAPQPSAVATPPPAPVPVPPPAAAPAPPPARGVAPPPTINAPQARPDPAPRPTRAAAPARPVPSPVVVERTEVAPVANRPRPAAKRMHTVAAGESLWTIASARLGAGASSAAIAREVDRLWRLNAGAIRSGRPDLLAVGERLRT